MSTVIKLKRGLDLNLKGKPQSIVVEGGKSNYYSVCPDDFYGIVAKVMVKAGEHVEAGDPLLVNKNYPQMQFTSPVSGTIVAVNRGERRKLLDVLIEADAVQKHKDFGKQDVAKLTAVQILDSLLESGVFAFIKQRPYDVIANPEVMPRDIFVTAFDSAPLAPDFNFVLNGQEADFQTGISALRKLTKGKVYVGTREGKDIPATGATMISFEGAHPAGNVGIQIHHIAPINKGEVVWALNAFDVLFIGRLFNKGIADFSRLIAVTGSEVEKPAYVQTIFGASMESLLVGNLKKSDYHQRFISGNVLTGVQVGKNGYLKPYNNQITVIPEGDDYNELLGWAMPRLNRFSVSHTYFSWLFGAKKEYAPDARLMGGVRAIIMSGEYERVLPMDILPEFLIKAILANDLEKMENLGIYEVAPEDFALCEYVDTSKLTLQQIVRDGLDQLQKEMN